MIYNRYWGELWLWMIFMEWMYDIFIETTKST